MRNLKEAMFYKKLKEEKVNCNLCPHSCVIPVDEAGECGVRKNVEGKLYSLVHSKACALSIDPIEKKPLYHFFPGAESLSVATVGCNFSCHFCQNYNISQISPEKVFGDNYPPEKIVELAERYGSKIISYTYTEPTIFYEYAFDTMKLAKEKGLKNIWVSNGYTNIEPIKKMAPFLDAINIDVKGNEEVYKSLCGASLQPVLNSLKEYKKHNIWIEVTSLIIPGYNDSLEWINFLSKWINDNLGKKTPLHLSRFSPQYKMLETEPTPLKTLEKLYGAAKKKLDYIYIGNIPTSRYGNTYCPKCGDLAIRREGFKAEIKKLKCEKCNEKIPGVFD